MKALALYDGDCGVCARVVAVLAPRTSAAIDWRPWQGEAVLPAGAGPQRLERELVFVDAHGATHGGARAFAAILRHVRGAHWLGVSLAAPGIRCAADAAYSLFARHRARISQLLGLTSCRISARKSRPALSKKDKDR